MVDVDIKNEKFQHWLSVSVALSIVAEGVTDYVIDTTNRLHQKLYRNLASNPNCCLNCSKRYKSTDQWCVTCQEWKKEIESHQKNKNQKVTWTEIDSADWPGSVKEMVKVFCPKIPEGGVNLTSDISAMMNLLDNCKEFVITKLNVKNIRTIRNKVAHNNSLKLSERDMNDYFQKLEQLLLEKVIKATESGTKALASLRTLRNTGIKKYLDINDNSTTNQQTTPIKRESITEIQDKVLERLQGKKQRLRNILDITVIGMLIVFVVVLRITGLSENRSPIHVPTDDCVNIEFNNPWEFDVDFNGYLKEHRQFTGRKWLVRKLESELWKNKRKGIIITADMGFGKSALVSNILCSNDISSGKNIKDMVISYHICRFDTISTQNPAYFIRNLAGNIINKLPEYGQNIRKNNLAMKYLSSEVKCSEDPVGCLDFGIIHPLMETTSNLSRYVIIDALDECKNSDDRKVSILTILQIRINKLPRWIKFLITSREDEQLIRGLTQFKQIKLSSQKSENKEDVKEYIKSKLVRPVWYSLIPGTQSYTDQENVAALLLDKSGGNFLFVVTILEYWSRSEFPLIHEIPTSLREIYEHNFRRSIGKVPFSQIKNLLKILVSSTRELSEKELFSIAQIKSNNEKETCLKVLKPFVSRIGNRIRLAHIAIAEIFFDTKQKSNFYFSKQHGHLLFAKYYIHVERQWNLSNIAEIVLHVSESNDRDIENEFQKRLKKSNLNNESLKKQGESLLHHLVRYIDSYNAVKLIVSTININKNDYRNIGNVSAEFLAAAFGHSKSLEYILDKQVGTKFAIKPARKMLHDGVNFCKFIGLCGYNMLQVAAQFGHDSVVQLLLFRDKSLVYEKIILV